MDTLLDYVKWMEDFDFRAIPLREADVLVLCLVSYFDLTPAFAGETSRDIFLRDMIPLADSGKARLLITGGDMGNRAVFEAAVHSKRFGSLRMTDCVDLLSEDPPLQFAAVTFRSDEFSLIAFRGTDSSLAGWKENFMIAFTRTRAQKVAAGYANQVIASSVGPCYIAGHSKGSNLALYAGCLLTEANLEKTRRIYALDGPGFCPDVVDPALIRRIDAKTVFINPEFDIIGKILAPRLSDVRIIASFREGIAQHSLPSWLIDHGKLALLPANDPRSTRLNQILDEWIADKSPAVRKLFIDELFDTIAEKGITDFEELRLDSLIEIMIGLHSASDSTKDALKELNHRLLAPDDLFESSLEKARSDLKELRSNLEARSAKMRLR